MRGKGRVAIVGGIGAIAGAFALASASVPPKRPEIQGHRGARARFPENTLPAFRHAIAAGADVLELDVGVSRDGQLVVTHDMSLNPELCLAPGGARIPTPPPRVRDLTLAELQAYDCGSLRNPKFPRQALVPGTPMPSLDEVLALGRDHPKLKFNIEAKSDPDGADLTASPSEFARLILEAVRRHGLLERANIQSFDPRVLMESRALDPALPRALLSMKKVTSLLWEGWRTGARIISPHYQLLFYVPGRAAALRAAGFELIPWTANEPEVWEKLVSRNVDGIITDDPQGLREWLDERGI